MTTVEGMDLDRARTEIRAFVAERDWSQFHSSENLAKSIAIEVSSFSNLNRVEDACISRLGFLCAGKNLCSYQ